MRSARFNLDIVITQHAQLRMTERGISKEEILELIESGEIKHKDATHLWIYKNFQNRSDNMICAASVIENALIIKTIMHHFSPKNED